MAIIWMWRGLSPLSYPASPLSCVAAGDAGEGASFISSIGPPVVGIRPVSSPPPGGAPCAEGDSAESPVLIPAGQAGALRLWSWACGASPAWELGFRYVPYTVAAPGGSLATRRAVRGAGRNASIGMMPDD